MSCFRFIGPVSRVSLERGYVLIQESPAALRSEQGQLPVVSDLSDRSVSLERGMCLLRSVPPLFVACWDGYELFPIFSEQSAVSHWSAGYVLTSQLAGLVRQAGNPVSVAFRSAGNVREASRVAGRRMCKPTGLSIRASDGWPDRTLNTVW